MLGYALDAVVLSLRDIGWTLGVIVKWLVILVVVPSVVMLLIGGAFS